MPLPTPTTWIACPAWFAAAERSPEALAVVIASRGRGVMDFFRSTFGEQWGAIIGGFFIALIILALLMRFRRLWKRRHHVKRK